MSLQVGVFGATGYAGRELVRLVSSHPAVELAFTTGSGPDHLAHEAALEETADVYFLALPHGVSGRFAGTLAKKNPDALVIDLSGDLRLPDAASYERWYGHAPTDGGLLGRVPYGLPELFADRIRSARVVSNPGCYATSALLALAPLLKDKLVDPEDVIVDAKSGATGAGRAPREDLMFCEVADDLSAYAPGRAHRHVGEIESILHAHAGASVALTFCPYLLPVKRGILSAVYVRTRESADALREALRLAYAGSPFVRVVDGAPPRLSDVVGTNDCRLSVHDAAPGRAVVFSALDNLLKGAAGQAVQNMNLASGFAETAGLPAPAAR